MNKQTENIKTNNKLTGLSSLNYCFFLPSEGFGGLEIQTLKRCEDCAEYGHKSLLVVSPNTKLNEKLKSTKQKYQLININLDYIDIFSAFRLVKIFNRNNIDICIVSQSKMLSLALMSRFLYKKLHNKKLAIVFYQHMQSKIDKKDFFHNLIYKNIDGAITVTKIMIQDLIDTTIIKPEKITNIALGTNLEKFHPDNFNKIECRKIFNLPEDKFIIGYISRIEKHKDQITAIKALKEANIENSVLVICGMIGEQSYKQEIDKVISEISKTEPDFDKRIIFLDFTENVAELMNAFDVFIMSSRSETFGLVNIEALASGLPVLATNSGGIPEIIKDNYNGLLFSREDFMEASRKLKLLYKSPELMKKLSENALEDVKNKYDYKTQTDKFFEFCNVVYNNRIKKSN